MAPFAILVALIFDVSANKLHLMKQSKNISHMSRNSDEMLMKPLAVMYASISAALFVLCFLGHS